MWTHFCQKPSTLGTYICDIQCKTGWTCGCLYLIAGEETCTDTAFKPSLLLAWPPCSPHDHLQWRRILQVWSSRACDYVIPPKRTPLHHQNQSGPPWWMVMTWCEMSVFLSHLQILASRLFLLTIGWHQELVCHCDHWFQELVHQCHHWHQELAWDGCWSVWHWNLCQNLLILVHHSPLKITKFKLISTDEFNFPQKHLN